MPRPAGTQSSSVVTLAAVLMLGCELVTVLVSLENLHLRWVQGLLSGPEGEEKTW